MEVVILAKLPDNILTHSFHFRRWDLSCRGGRGGTWWWKVRTSKNGGKQWQVTPKNLPRMHHTRAIPVVWLNSGLCPDRPKGWIPIIIIIIIINLRYAVHSVCYLLCDRQYIVLYFINRAFSYWLVWFNCGSEAATKYLLVRTMVHVRNRIAFPCGEFFNCFLQNGTEIWSSVILTNQKSLTFPVCYLCL